MTIKPRPLVAPSIKPRPLVAPRSANPDIDINNNPPKSATNGRGFRGSVTGGRGFVGVVMWLVCSAAFAGEVGRAEAVHLTEWAGVGGSRDGGRGAGRCRRILFIR